MKRRIRRALRRHSLQLEKLEHRQLLAVAVLATDATAAETLGDGEPNLGSFTIKRSEPFSAPLTVGYSIGGTASNGADYLEIASSVTIPSGAASIAIPIAPKNDAAAEGTETVVLHLTPSEDYTILGEHGEATVKILDNDSPPAGPQVALKVFDASAAETNDGQEANTGKFRLVRTGSADAALTVKYTIGGTAGNGLDYTEISSTASIPAGSEGTFITIAPLNDSAVENPESVVLRLTPTDGYTILGEHGEAAVKILDNEAPPRPFIAIKAFDASAAETNEGQEANPGKFRLVRSGPLDAALTVKYTIGGTAGNGVDYKEISSTATIPAGSEGTFITISPINDSAAEEPETVVLRLTPTEGYTILGEHGQAAVKILDNDSQPVGTKVSIVAFDASAAETNAGQEANTGKFKLLRSGPVDAALTVKYTIGGTASNGVDYTDISGTAVIPAGSEHTVITIAPINDSAVEEPESVILRLTPSEAYAIHGEGAAIKILDNDSQPVGTKVSIVAFDASAAETNAGQEANTGKFKLLRSGPVDAALTVKYTIGGTAGNGEDYTEISGTAVIPAGSEGTFFTISPINDSAVEKPESVILRLTPSEAYAIHGEGAAVKILDNDSQPIGTKVSIVAFDASAAETNAGQEANVGKFKLLRSGSVDAALTVKYTIGGTAGNGVDYTEISGTAVIPAGSEGTFITIAPINDSTLEEPESVILHLTPSEAYAIHGEGAAVKIHDNDSQPVGTKVSIVAFDATAAETNAGQEANIGKFKLIRSGSVDVALTVKYTIGGTAGNGVDYTEISGTAVIPAGSEGTFITIAPINDSTLEEPESVILHLTPTEAYAIHGEGGAAVKIHDNDSQPVGTKVSIVAHDAVAAETNEGQEPNRAKFMVTRTGSLDAPLTVRIERGGSAQNGVDYQELAATVVIPAGQSTAYILLLVKNDDNPEETETVLLSIQASEDYAVNGEHGSASATIADNDVAGADAVFFAWGEENPRRRRG